MFFQSPVRIGTWSCEEAFTTNISKKIKSPLAMCKGERITTVKASDDNYKSKIDYSTQGNLF